MGNKKIVEHKQIITSEKKPCEKCRASQNARDEVMGTKGKLILMRYMGKGLKGTFEYRLEWTMDVLVDW